MDGGDWISLAGVIIAGGSAVWSVVSARQANKAQAAAKDEQIEAKKQAGRAVEAAEKASAAQVEAAAAASRAADALEKHNRLVVEQAEAAEGVPWRVEHRSGAKWELHNDHDQPKFGVHISGGGVSKGRHAPEIIDRIDGRGSVEFWGDTSWGAGYSVTVTWHRLADRSDDALSWSGTMPAAD
ncbi:hypothetical protein GR927_35975 [Mycolicibacterium sp. 3033]|nr:hypothetical protein [Mycolicibacterium aurantiacum]